MYHTRGRIIRGPGIAHPSTKLVKKVMAKILLVFFVNQLTLGPGHFDTAARFKQLGKETVGKRTKL